LKRPTAAQGLICGVNESYTSPVSLGLSPSTAGDRLLHNPHSMKVQVRRTVVNCLRNRLGLTTGTERFRSQRDRAPRLSNNPHQLVQRCGCDCEGEAHVEGSTPADLPGGRSRYEARLKARR